jgi:hypothetical protein
MPKEKKKVSDEERPTAENNYLFDHRVQRLMQARGMSLQEAEDKITELIHREHPDWQPPEPVKDGHTIAQINEAISEEPPGKPEIHKVKGKKEKIAEEGFLTTKDLADKFGMTTVALRRILRGMALYNDGTFTRYRWNGWDDPAIALIEKELKSEEKAAANNA